MAFTLVITSVAGAMPVGARVTCCWVIPRGNPSLEEAEAFSWFMEAAELRCGFALRPGPDSAGGRGPKEEPGRMRGGGCSQVHCSEAKPNRKSYTQLRIGEVGEAARGCGRAGTCGAWRWQLLPPGLELLRRQLCCEMYKYENWGITQLRLCCRGCVGGVVSKEFQASCWCWHVGGGWEMPRSKAWGGNAPACLGWTLGLDLSCSASWPDPSRSPPGSPAPAAPATPVGSVPAPSPHTWSPKRCLCHQRQCPSPRYAGTPTQHRAQGPGGKYVIQTQKHAQVSIGTPNVFRQTWVCLLFTYSSTFTPAGMCVWIYLPGHIFWRANQQGKHESTKKHRHKVLCV